MAGTQSAPRLRPLNVPELLDAAIKVCTAHAGTLFKAVVVVILPVQILSAVILASTVDDPAFLDITTSDTGSDDDPAFWAGQAVVTLLGVVSYILATGACFHAIAQGWMGRQPDWRESLRFAAKRAPSLLWISFLYGLGAALGFVACLIPGIWLSIAWCVAFPVLFVEDLRGSKALRRSFHLVKNRWWPTFGVVLLGFVLAGIVGSVFQYGLGLLALVNDSLGFLILITTVGTFIASVLTTPFQAAIVTVVYFDLRVRKEGFDLELLAQRLAGGDPLPQGQGPAPWSPQPAPANTWQPAPAPSGWQPPADPATSSSGWQPPGSEPAPPDPASSPAAGESPPGWLPPKPDER